MADEIDLDRWHDDGGASPPSSQLMMGLDVGAGSTTITFVGADQLGNVFECPNRTRLEGYLHGRNDLIDSAVAALKRGARR